MQKKTSKAMQGRADGTRVLAVQDGDDKKLTDEERYNLLRERAQNLQLKLKTVPYKGVEYKAIGTSLAKINFEINQLRGTKKERPGIGAIFIDVAYRILPRDQYNLILAEAQHIYDLRYSQARKLSAEKYATELGVAIERVKRSNPTRDTGAKVNE